MDYLLDVNQMIHNRKFSFFCHRCVRQIRGTAAKAQAKYKMYRIMISLFSLAIGKYSMRTFTVECKYHSLHILKSRQGEVVEIRKDKD